MPIQQESEYVIVGNIDVIKTSSNDSIQVRGTGLTLTVAKRVTNQSEVYSRTSSGQRIQARPAVTVPSKITASFSEDLSIDIDFSATYQIVIPTDKAKFEIIGTFTDKRSIDAKSVKPLWS